MSVERELAAIGAHLENVGREMGEVRKELKNQCAAIAAWPATCAEHRAELERRVSNGKAKLVVTTATITAAVITAAGGLIAWLA